MENIIVQEKENNSLSITNSDHESDISPVYSPVSQEKAQQVSTNNKRKSLAKTKESTSQNDSASENDEQDVKLRKNNEKSIDNSSSKKKEISAVISKNTKIPNLPAGWTYKKLLRRNGPTAGKIDFYVFSPEGKKFRTLTELKQFLNKTLKYQDIVVDSYDFFKFGLDKPKGSLRKQTKPLNKNEAESPKKPVKKQLRSVIKNSPQMATPSPKRKLVGEQRKRKKSENENVDNKLSIKQKATRLILPQSEIWIPPKSPYKLIQEDLYNEPWQLLIGTIFLNCTKGNIALPLIEEFLKKWPYPRDLIKSNLEEIKEFIKPIGLEEKRAYQLKRFTEEYLNKTWKYPKELYGIGKYGNDSYRIFCMNEWKLVRPHDMRLTMYLNWLWTNHEYLQID